MSKLANFNDVQFVGDIRLDNIHAQNKMLEYDNLITQDYTYLLDGEVQTLNSPFSFDTPLLEAITLDSERILALYYHYNSYNLAIIGIDGVIIGDLMHIVPLWDLEIPKMIKIDTDKILIVYGYHSSDARAQIITTEDNVITFKTSTKFSSFQSDKFSVDLLDSSNVIVSYRNVSTEIGYVQVLNIFGTLILQNESNKVSINDSDIVVGTNICQLSSSKVLISYTDGSTLSGKIRVGNILENNIELGPIFDLDSNYSEISEINVKKINENKVITAFIGDTFGVVKMLNISENNITRRDSKLFFYLEEVSKVNLDIIDSSIAIVGYIVDYVNKKPYTTILEISGNNVEIQNYQLLINYAANCISLCVIGDTAYALFQQDPSMLCRFVTISSIQLDTSTKCDYDQQWDNIYTSFLANFENTLEAGNITNEITGWRLKRKAEDGSLFITINEFEPENIEYVDYLVRNNINYTYALFSLNSSGESLGIEDSASVDFYGWILTDGVNAYKFDSGWDSYKTENISSDISYNEYDTCSQYPIVSFGQKNYKTSSITTIPYSYNSVNFTYTIDISLLNEVRDFINNKTEKYLKNTAGEIFKVVTKGFSVKYDDKIQSQPYEISFDWIEIDECEDGV